jgi:hypothetical protein
MQLPMQAYEERLRLAQELIERRFVPKLGDIGVEPVIHLVKVRAQGCTCALTAWLCQCQLQQLALQASNPVAGARSFNSGGAHLQPACSQSWTTTLSGTSSAKKPSSWSQQPWCWPSIIVAACKSSSWGLCASIVLPTASILS